jgi:hypothetical protein
MNHFELPINRARALYTIPTAPPRARALELCGAREPLFLNANWRGESYTVCALGRESYVSDSILHADAHRALPFAPNSASSARGGEDRFNALVFLKDVRGLLSPGGVVAGTLSNRSSPRRLAAALTQRGNAADAAAFYTLRTSRKLLHETGLVDIRIFSVLPNWQAPLRLVEAESSTAKFAFRQELERRQKPLSVLGSFLRKLAIDSGLSAHLEDSIFFWGYKPT